MLRSTVLGYVVINGATFALDLGMLATMRTVFGWPLPVAVTLSYATAFAISFALNRRYNFRSHAPVAGQLRVYVVVVALNYLLWILGAVDGLAALGVPYLLARLLGGCCEAVYMYSAMRWIVFRDVSPAARSAGSASRSPIHDAGGSPRS